MKLIRNMFYNTSYQLLTLILPLITVPYVSRILSPTGIGINAYTSSIVMYFTLFGALGISLYGNREIAFVQNNKYKRSKVFWELVFLKFITVSIASVFYLIFVFWTKDWTSFYLLQGINLLAIATDISWYYLGIEDFKRIVVRNTIVKLTTVTLTFILVKTKNDLGLYIFLIAFAALLGNLTVWSQLKEEVIRIPFKRLSIFKHLKPTLMLFLPQITMQIYLSLNKSMLGAMDSVVSAGYFDQSDKIIRILFTIVSAIGGVFLPRLSSLFSNGKKEEAKSLLIKLIDLSNAISMLMIAGVVGVSSTFATFFFGKDYAQVGALMAVQSFMIIFISYGNALGTQYLLASKRTKAYTYSAVVGLIINVIGNIILIPILGAMGAIISTVLTEFAVSLYQIISLRDVFSIKELTRGLLRYSVAALVTASLIYYMDSHMSISFINYGLQTIVGVSTYIIIIYLLKTPVIDLFRNFKRGL
ncbi:oligosaccharide flippase family protein [Streptococcus porcinus]|uniref:Membrane protein involved in the export of O-antigen, teichoic acid lipoteichoic acids n=1 Tax=Streptococcus porcinus TaxID=1340 RepID=A0A4V0H7M3_STRPO|nr:oligosaccharide flippase family protein [Streptococcus porcinus]VTT44435.1 Membrane protein involved in the export of O-antigen, teichoic acid lipoteichoic acids [Streptococcus porcinus]VTT45734.1 Membrane protein involved in the export of O-antigen, teichoic acid lipoteichoic acids [Streptococcus porcinus]